MASSDRFTLGGDDDDVLYGTDSPIKKDEDDEDDSGSLTLNIPGITPSNSNSIPLSIPSRSPASDSSDDDDDSDDDSSPSISPIDKQKMLLAQATGKMPVESRMNTGDAIASLLGVRQNEMSSAQNLRNNLQLLSNLSHAGQTAGAAFVPMSRVKPDEQAYMASMAQANQPVQDVAQNQLMQGQMVKDLSQQQLLKTQLAKDDPNSDISKMYNKLLTYNASKLGMADMIPQNVTASEAENIQKILAQEASRHDNLEARRVALQQSKDWKETVLGKQDDKTYEKAATLFENNINPAKASSRSPMGRSQLVVDSAKRINQLLTQYPNLNDMPKNQIAEVATALNSMLTNGSPSVAGTHMLVPTSSVGDVNGIISYITNQLKGAGQKEFAQNMKDTIGREQVTSQDIVKNYQKQMADAEANSSWAQQKPERYKKITDSLHVYDEPKMSKDPESSQVKVLNPATGQVHSMSPEQAQEAITKGGGQIIQ